MSIIKTQNENLHQHSIYIHELMSSSQMQSSRIIELEQQLQNASSASAMIALPSFALASPVNYMNGNGFFRSHGEGEASQAASNLLAWPGAEHEEPAVDMYDEQTHLS